MRNTIIAALLFGFLGFAAEAQTATRPRVVRNPAPPVIKGDTTNSSSRRPPVLKGDTSADGDIGEPPPLPAPPPIEEDEVIRIETNLVAMPVTVLDRNGRFVSGLRQRDFQIFENDVEQQVGYFERVETPFTVILMLDVSPSTQYRIDEIQNAAVAFVNQLRAEDRVMVIAFDEHVTVLSRPTNNRIVLERAIRRAQFGDGTSLYDAVDQVINRELRQLDGRKAVVLFTDGVDTTSRSSNYQTTVREVEETDALFYPIRYDTYSGNYSGGTNPTSYPRPRRRSGGGLGGILGDILGGIVIGGRVPGGGSSPAGSSRAEYETGKQYLEDLARNSGGRNFDATTTTNLDSAFAGIAEELRQQYSIGYYPAAIGQRGERKRIRIRVMRPNLVVRAKDYYVVGKNGS